MNRDEFIEALTKASPKLNIEHVDEVLHDSLSPAGEKLEGFMNLIIVMEEFAECQQQVSKFLRSKGDHISLLEETADAFLCIRYIQQICGITDEELSRAVNVKIDRQDARNKGKLSGLDVWSKPIFRRQE